MTDFRQIQGMHRACTARAQRVHRLRAVPGGFAQRVAAVLLGCVLLFGTQVVAQSAGVSDLIGYCERAIADRAVPAALAKVLKQDPKNAFTRKASVRTAEGPIFVSVIENTDTGAMICMLEGAQHKGGTRWSDATLWAPNAAKVEAALDRYVPRGAIETTKTPDALDLHLYQRAFTDCRSNRFWNTGPHYKSDSGFLFPVSIDWRLEGAVFAYQVGAPLLRAARQKHCQ